MLPDAGSIPAASTSLRFERSEKEKAAANVINDTNLPQES